MLRRKLLLVLGSVVTLLLVAGLAAILMLQDVLQDLSRAEAQSTSAAQITTQMNSRLSSLQAQLIEREDRSDGDQTAVRESVESIQQDARALDELDAAATLDAGAMIDRLRSLTDQLNAQLEQSAAIDSRSMILVLEELRRQLSNVDVAIHAHTGDQHAMATSKFRWTAICLGLAFVLIINVSIMVFSRMSSMILKPIDRLVDAARCWGREEFQHRIQMNGSDEFGELARAYNGLAAQLESNEQRKIETLHQVARTLNHELNNAISIVQSQLDLLSRNAPGNGKQDHLQEQFRGRLREIHQAMARMSAIAADLTRVRRIVLTDYLSGVKMLDLQRSVQDEPVPEPMVTKPQVHANDRGR